MINILVKDVVPVVLPRRDAGRSTASRAIEAGAGLREVSLVSGGDRNRRDELSILALLAPGAPARPAEIGMFARDV